jgi:hypothetical protein
MIVTTISFWMLLRLRKKRKIRAIIMLTNPRSGPYSEGALIG